MDSRKLAPRFIGPFPMQRIFIPVTVQLKLPASIRIHLVFHTSQIKPYTTSPFLHPGESPPPSPRIIESAPGCIVRRLLDEGEGVAFNTWSTSRAMGQRNFSGSHSWPS